MDMTLVEMDVFLGRAKNYNLLFFKIDETQYVRKTDRVKTRQD
jgi:hypothetical protein